MLFLFAWRSGILRRCTRGQSLSTHTGIQRLNIPPSARSQTGDIRQGYAVSARPSVTVAPHFAPTRGPGSPGTREPRQRLGQGPSRAEPSRAAGALSLRAAGCRHRSRLPDGLRLRPAWGRNAWKGLSPPWEAPGTPRGLSDSAHLPAARSHPGLGAERETQPGPQRGQHRSGARESAFAAPERVMVGLGLSVWATHASCPGSGTHAAPMRGEGCWLNT